MDEAIHKLPPIALPQQETRPVGRYAATLRFLRGHLRLLRWIVPAGLLVLVVVYELSASQWMLRSTGPVSHALADGFVFGVLGPVLAFFLIDLVDKYLVERETSDLQAQLLAQVKDDAQKSRQLSDDAVQVLYSASTLIETLKPCQPDLAQETSEQIDTAEKALSDAIAKLRSHLLT